MRQILWLGVVLLAASFVFFLPIYTPPDLFAGFFILFFGVLCVISGIWDMEIRLNTTMIVILLLAVSIACLVVPFPYSIGLLVLNLGLIVLLLSTVVAKVDLLTRISSGICFSGIVLILPVALFPLYVLLAVHYHRIDILSNLVSSLGNLFGLHSSVNNGVLFVPSLHAVYPFTTTTEKLGFFLFFNIFIVALFIIFCCISKRRTQVFYLVGFVVSSGLYLVLRYVVMIFLFINGAALDIFWNPYFMVLSFMPLAFLYMKFFPLPTITSSFHWCTAFRRKKNHVAALILISVFVFSAIGAGVYHDPGQEKNRRILIDEYHSEWADTTHPMDTQWYGVLSTYNYYSFVEWLRQYYTVEQNIHRPLDAELLENYDILILKCPTIAYSTEEIQAVVDFVHGGGGLYLIGDHTNVFGMNTYLNQISERFRIRFKTDATYELGTGDYSTFQPDSLFPHPIMQYVQQFDFLTSCTLDVPLASEYVIIGNQLIAEPGTYATENFFRQSVQSPESEFGLLLQVAARKHGRGRVVAFTDSTCFSNFCMFTDGYTTFNLGVLEYLNRENVSSSLPHLFFVCAIFSVILALFLLRKEKKVIVVVLFLLMGSFSFSIAAPLFSELNKIHYPLPLPHSNYTTICFDMVYSDIIVDTKPTIFATPENREFGTFFVWTQRIGCVPSLEKSLGEALQKGTVVVIINPVVSFSAEDRQSIAQYVHRGGRVLMMDSIFNTNSTANQLLEVFDMQIIRNTVQNHTTQVNDSHFYLSISGGFDIEFPYDIGISAAAFEVYNQTTGAIGKIVTLVDSSLFSDVFMGDPFTEPDTFQKQLYLTEFYIFEQVLLSYI